MLLEGHEQKLAFLAGEVGRNNQKVDLLEGEVESRLVAKFDARFQAMHKERQELQGEIGKMQAQLAWNAQATQGLGQWC